MFKIMIQLIQITMLLIPLNSAYSAEASFLKGNYAFTGVYNCLGAPNGGFDSIGQPVNESYSGLANITINGFMRFDGAGNSTQEGNFVEITSSAHPLNLSKPRVSSGTFSIAPSAYTISNKRDVLVTPGTTDVIALTGFDAGFTLIITTESGHLSGSFSPDKKRDGCCAPEFFTRQP